MSSTNRPASILDGFFTADRAAVIAALNAIDDVTHPDHSYGRVSRVDPWKVDGILSERIFGVLHANHTPGGDPSTRLWRFGHVDIPPTPHPLVSDVLVEKVPIPPPGDRPLVEPLTTAQKLDWIGPTNALWCNLVRRANRIERMKQIEAPQITIDFEMTRIARDLALVVEATRTPPLPDARVWWTPSEPEPLTLSPAATFGADDTRLVFLDDTRIIVQPEGSHEIVVASIGGRILHRFPSPSRALKCVHTDLVAFDGWVGGDPLTLLHDAGAPANAPVTPLALYDVEAHRYLARWPATVPCVVARVFDDDMTNFSSSHLLDNRTGDIVEMQMWGDVEARCWSRDGRFVWLTDARRGLVVDAYTGIPQIETAHSSTDAVGRAFAATTNGEWRFVDAHGEYTDGRGDVVRHLGPVDAAAFSPECTRLAFVRDDVIHVVDDAFVEVRRFPVPR